ncbi:MAG: hypothetical protein H6819_03445 [Phycisphaerales bacterium]|nr:hypothetical protein [Phycisphaerales bacterium]MCB9856251.1 hypothetical protein [Phycisphaerales bacterium]MCB9863310.1 hypothetical protein [Phycisphaerales bacterium]
MRFKRSGKRLMRGVSPIRVLLNRRPKYVPAGFWRQFVERQTAGQLVLGVSTWAVAIIASLVIIMGLAMILEGLGLKLGISRRMQWSFWAAYTYGITLGLVFLIPFSAAKHSINRRFVDRLVDTNACVCTQCAYNLVGLDSSGKCPECGAGFEMSATRQAWCEWFPELKERLAIAAER